MAIPNAPLGTCTNLTPLHMNICFQQFRVSNILRADSQSLRSTHDQIRPVHTFLLRKCQIETNTAELYTFRETKPEQANDRTLVYNWW